MPSASAATQQRWWRVAAVLWLALVLGTALHQWWFWQHPSLSTNMLALLPQDENSSAASLATERLAEQASRQVVVAIGTPQWADTQRALAAWRAAMDATTDLYEQPIAQAKTMAQAVAFYAPYRDRLLTPEQRQQLRNASAPELVGNALMALMQPGPSGRLTPWRADPLGLWAQWWGARAGDIRARLQEGEAYVHHDGLEWGVLVYASDRSAMSFDGQAHWGQTLAHAQQAVAAAVPGARLLQAGIPLHAEAAAVQAHGEINTIGWGSLAAVMGLLWLAFRAVRPMALTALSLVVGAAMATSATVLVFGQIHLVTLIFGSSLIGVAEDYGIHYFSARQAAPTRNAMVLMRSLLPGLLLALLTSVLGYWVLGFAPFPGLRQMAFFSVAGLIATFATAACWFPWLDARSAPKLTPLARRVGESLPHWPRWRSCKTHWALALGLAVFAAIGGARMVSNDDLRQLQMGRSDLIAQQREMSALLGLPSPTQYYLIKGHDAEEVLQREEALKARLDVLVAQGTLQGYRALSDWVPSQAQQVVDAQLTARVESAVVAGVARSTGEALEREHFADQALTLPQWLGSEVSRPARSLWLGDIGNGQAASVLMLRGSFGPEQLPPLVAAAHGLAGVAWMDRTASFSALLASYRVAISEWLVLGHVLVFAVLAWRYKKQAWRAWLPTLLATGLTLACLGWLGQPIQIFHVLALVLLLGVGVDYGVFLLEHPDDGGAWLAVILGSLSTVLSFGLLGLSQVPPLRAFGLTVLLGLAWVLLLSPLLRLSRSSTGLAVSAASSEAAQ